MRVKDVGMTTAEFFFSAVFDGLELAARESNRGAKASSFALEIFLCNLGAIDFACAFL